MSFHQIIIIYASLLRNCYINPFDGTLAHPVFPPGGLRYRFLFEPPNEIGDFYQYRKLPRN